MMATDAVRAASVGIGWWSDEWAKAARRTEALRIVACYTRSEEKRRRFAKEFGCREKGSYEELLQDPEVEAVLLSTPHSVHADQTVAAAGAGKHVLCQKPLTLTVRDALRASEACRRAGVVLAAGHQRRRQPGVRKLKELLEGGTLGRAVQVEGNLSYGLGWTLKPGNWRGDPQESPSGGMTALGVHHADTFQYLLGPVTRVMAMSKSLFSETPLEDVTSLLLEFESGAQGYLSTNLVSPKVFSIHVFGTEANAIVENEGTRLRLQRKGKDEWEEVPLPHIANPLTDPLVEELGDFARAIRGGGKPEVGAEEGTRAVAVLEATGLSAREGRAVELRELYP
ncbi:MAG: Gfo/Idh/MocA family protein [Nitrospinota bacterium]